MIRKIKEGSIVFAAGAAGYSLLEILWRGFTHWTMGVAGGVCFSIIYWLQNRCRHSSRVKKCFQGMVVITAVEYLVGSIVNLKLRWNVWDYSDQLLNIKGQICPLFMGLWFCLSAFIFPIAAALKKMLQR